MVILFFFVGISHRPFWDCRWSFQGLSSVHDHPAFRAAIPLVTQFDTTVVDPGFLKHNPHLLQQLTCQGIKAVMPKAGFCRTLMRTLPHFCCWARCFHGETRPWKESHLPWSYSPLAGGKWRWRLWSLKVKVLIPKHVKILVVTVRWGEIAP